MEMAPGNTDNEEYGGDELTLEHSNASIEGDDSSYGASDSEGEEIMSSRAGENTPVDEIKMIKENLSKKESRDVLKLRIIVMILLLLTAIAVSITIFFITRGGESEEFRSSYEGSAEKVATSFSLVVREMGAVSGLAIAFSSHQLENDEVTWPFVTLPNFHQRGANVRSMSRALSLSMAPMVTMDKVERWDTYTRSKANSWMDEAWYFQNVRQIDDFEYEPTYAKERLTDEKVDPLHYYENNQIMRENQAAPYYLPIWQVSPLLKRNPVNENILRQENTSSAGLANGTALDNAVIADIVLNQAKAVLGGFDMAPPGDTSSDNRKTSRFASLLSIADGVEVAYKGDPMANFYIPVFNNFNATSRKVVGVMTALVHWSSYFRRVLPNNIKGIDVVLDNSCEGSFTYRIDGPEAYVIGEGDHHNPAFDNWQRTTRFQREALDDGTKYGLELHKRGCYYMVHVYPSQEFYDTYNTHIPATITCAMLAVFIFTIAVFMFYDRLVERRQEMVVQKAAETTAVVASLFPKNVRDRLIEAQTEAMGHGQQPGKAQKGFMNTDVQGSAELVERAQQAKMTQPIADLFPNCTVFFADIAGFTAWSSTREPGQVFILLQNVYQAFDKIAKRRRVFKVETIGDCYMAVTGLPEPQPTHASIMARFAFDCLLKMNDITKELESVLGPDTSDLTIRCGLHSGPVTAGVLMGERARFQLFGDTVNTASRMESTGRRGRIQVSKATADCLKESGKEVWLTQREDTVEAKGKGTLTTFWVDPTNKSGSSVSSGRISQNKNEDLAPTFFRADFQEVNERLVDWMAELLLENIKNVILERRHRGIKPSNKALKYVPPEGAMPMDEVLEYIEMPEFEKTKKEDGKEEETIDDVKVDEDTIKDLKTYIHVIASWYRNNPFHNFDHACHVTMSVWKLLKRVQNPELSKEQQESMKEADDYKAFLHEVTHGLKSDPLAVLAIIFSALIHDVDHRGCSNMQLAKEEPEMAARYKMKSIAEQHSVDLAWDILMQDQYESLRRLLFATEAEMMRFRQLLVNVVLATDIFDQELNAARKRRWEHAFADKSVDAVDSIETEKSAAILRNKKATVVIEHIIQASDVSHTMQHWHVYQKWNRFLFVELKAAFHTGRLGKDPAEFWEKGEIGFFDNYIIPLAKKLKECGVFGVYSDEYLVFAQQNREEWEQRGGDIVSEWSDAVYSVIAKGGDIRHAARMNDDY